MIDVVIPVLNEEKTLPAILETLNKWPQVGTIIVVIDPDTRDNSWEIAVSYAGNGCILTSSTHGKGQCVKLGLEVVKTTRVMFCDADIIGLTGYHLHCLLSPNDTMVIGVPDFPDFRDIPPRFAPTMLWAWPWVSGQRTMLTEIARSVDLHGYLMETQLNDANHAAGKKVRLERLHGLTSPLDFNEHRLEEMNNDLQWGIEHGVLPKKGE